MFKIKHNFKRIISIMCVLTLLVQTLIVSANDANKSDFQLAIENATYTSTYADSETADMALETATKQVQAVISARADANENAATFVVNNPVLSVNAKGGTYTFTITVTLADSSSFTTDILTMNISARPEPLKVVFDNETTVNNAQFFNSSQRSLVTEDGKTFVRVEQNSSLRPLRYGNFAAQAGVSSIDFDKYPYVRISWKNNDVMGWNSAFFYWGPTATDNSFEIYPYQLDGSGTGWKEILFDMKAGQYTFLKGTGTYGTGGSCPTWSGEGLFSFTFSNSKGAFVGDIEYIAFFGSKAEAEAYPVEIGNLKTMLETAEYTAAYTDADSVEKATELVTPQVQAVIDEWTLDSGETATFTIQNGELSRYSKGGTFTFDVTVTEAGLAPYDVSLTMTIGARPKPLAVVFDDEETVSNAKFFNSSEKSLVTEGDKTFIRVAQTSTARPLRYSEVVNQLGVSKIDFDKYPYVKISWKNNDALGWNSAFLYWGTSSETENSYEFYAYGLNGQDTDWKEVLFDMRTGEYTFLKGRGTYGSSGTCTPNGTVPWAGEGYFSFTPSNSKGAFVGDIEYIAFFSSKTQAMAYPAVPDETVEQSMAILSATDFSCESDVASTKEDAHSEIAKQIAALNLPATSYTLEQGTYVAPTTSATGSYSVNVVFASGEKATVTMQIAKAPIKPVVWTFDNKSILSQFTATNAGMTYEDGYVKMTTSNPGYDDGFFLEGQHKSSR